MRLVLTLAALALAGCGSAHKQVKRAPTPPAGHRTYTLLTGDTARVPGAGTTCEASQEGGQKNLFCSRIGGGRNDVVFYADSVLVWKSPDAADSYRWTAGRSRPTDNTGGSHFYTLAEGDQIRVPGAATKCTASGEAGRPNLFCTPIGKGRYQVVFYPFAVIVWDLVRGPDDPAKSYEWAPR